MFLLLLFIVLLLLSSPKANIRINQSLIATNTNNNNRGVFDRNLIPNARERKTIQALIRSPSTKILNQKEKDFVWKFRYFLKDNKKALSKFLKCVEWTDMQQRKQVISLLYIFCFFVCRREFLWKLGYY